MTKILVADDDNLISSSLCEAFKDVGFEPTAAYDGEETLAKAKELVPDLIILDILLPKLDGMAVLWELKADSLTANILVVVLTNVSDVEMIGKIVAAGAADYLLKSDQSVESIVQKVQDVLARGVTLGN